jgi:hypothetical protein
VKCFIVICRCAYCDLSGWEDPIIFLQVMVDSREVEGVIVLTSAIDS